MNVDVTMLVFFFFATFSLLYIVIQRKVEHITFQLILEIIKNFHYQNDVCIITKAPYIKARRKVLIEI